MEAICHSIKFNGDVRIKQKKTENMEKITVTVKYLDNEKLQSISY